MKEIWNIGLKILFWSITCLWESDCRTLFQHSTSRSRKILGELGINLLSIAFFPSLSTLPMVLNHEIVGYINGWAIVSKQLHYRLTNFINLGVLLGFFLGLLVNNNLIMLVLPCLCCGLLIYSATLVCLPALFSQGEDHTQDKFRYGSIFTALLMTVVYHPFCYLMRVWGGQLISGGGVYFILIWICDYYFLKTEDLLSIMMEILSKIMQGVRAPCRGSLSLVLGFPGIRCGLFCQLVNPGFFLRSQIPRQPSSGILTLPTAAHSSPSCNELIFYNNLNCYDASLWKPGWISIRADSKGA